MEIRRDDGSSGSAPTITTEFAVASPLPGSSRAERYPIVNL
jgi:hypothetical protein